MLDGQVTFLTRAVPSRTDQVKQAFRNAARTLWYAARLQRPGRRSRFGGHPAVTRSLAAGLTALELPFNVDPTNIREVARACHVLSGVDALAQAIEWKKSGRIDRLTAGPNVVVLPSDCPHLLSAPELDLFLVNSDWTLELYQADLPALKGRCAIWPAGVDVDYWTPSPSERHKPGALVYLKTSVCSALVEQTEALLSQAGFSIIRIVYGNYTADQFRDALRASSLAVFFSEQESQGLALVEAWSCNVPTLVWENAAMVLGRNGKPLGVRSSSAPFLTAFCGLKFSGENDLEVALSTMIERLGEFRSREWTVREMSDSATSANLWKIIKEVA